MLKRYIEHIIIGVLFFLTVILPYILLHETWSNTDKPLLSPLIWFMVIGFWIYIGYGVLTTKDKPKNNVDIPRNTAHQTTKLSQVLKDAQKKPYTPVQTIGKFDRTKYDEIMAESGQSKKQDLSIYQPEKYIDSGYLSDKMINEIISITTDKSEKAPDKKQKHGVLMRHVALASKKQKQKAESISISVPDDLSCPDCGYKAKSIKALNGHRKAHSNK